MSRTKFAIAALPALLISTGVMAAGAGSTLPDAAAAPGFALTGIGGVEGFNLPSFGSGYFGHTVGGSVFGGMVGVNLTGTLGKAGDRDVVFGLSAFGAWGSGTTSFTDTLSGQGTVTITGMSAPTTTAPNPASTIDLTAGTSSAVVDNNPQGGSATGTATAAGGVNNIGFVQPATTGNSFVLGALSNSGGTPGTAAYGAIADSSGGIFIGTGDLTGVGITTSVTRSIGYGGGDLTVGLNGNVNENTQLLIYGGPSVRILNETDTTNVTVTMPVAPPSVTTFPNFGISEKDQLSSQYWGGVIGSSIALSSTPGVQFTLGGELGLYDVNASWNGQDTYSTCCGDFETNVSPAPNGVSPALSVPSTSSSASFGNTLGFAVRGNSGASFAIGGNKTITLGANAEYLSQVLQVTHASQTSTGGSTSFNSNTTISTAPSFSWGSMINYGGTISLTGAF